MPATATAVAASMAVLGLAEETGGSIQNPASAQGLVGIKPTFALVPNAGVMPLAANRDVVGPIARCVRDAALCSRCPGRLHGRGPEDHRGGRPPAEGRLRVETLGSALRGKRIGLYGPGWRTMPLSDEATRLYDRAKGELETLGAVLVEDPVPGLGLRGPAEADGTPARVRRARARIRALRSRALPSAPGPNAALKSFAAFAEATAAEDAFAPTGVLGFMTSLPQFAACLADPTRPPDLSEFIALKEAYLEIVDEVFTRERLDGLVFPQMRDALPPLHGSDTIHETTVGEINIAGCRVSRCRPDTTSRAHHSV